MSRSFKNAAYDQLARLGSALGHGTRLELLDMLCQAPKTVEALAADVAQSVANTSHHLQVLARARLVERERSGTYITYRLAGDDVCDVVVAIRRLGQARLFEMEDLARRYFEDRNALEAVDPRDLLGRVRAGEVCLLDVRPADEYGEGHLPGARSVPLAELEKRLNELPADRHIVAYCRGPLCVMSEEAVRLLKERGFRADRIPEGVAEFRAAGVELSVQ